MTDRLKRIAAAVTLASMLMVPAMSAQAALTDAQMQSILDLLSSFGADATTLGNVESALKGEATTGTTPTTGTISGIPTGYTFTRSLSVGSTGDDAKYLQILLNSSADTQVAASGAGSPGNETSYFGSLTAAAVSKFQNKYASEVLTPLGLTAGTGFFGASSRAKANALVASGTVPTTPTTPTTPTDPTTPETPATPGQISVAVSGPAASTIVQNQATANLANFVLTGSGTVTSVKLKRVGISADTALDNVFLFDGDVRLTDGGSVSSNSEITFTNPSGLFTVSGSKTVSVRADIDDAAAAGSTIGIQMLEVTLKDGTVTGVPVSGNLHNISAVALASSAIASATGSGDTEPGTGILVWQGQLTISTRDVTMTRLALRQIGSINQEDVNNFRLYVDGVEVGHTQNLDSNRYATFSLNKTLTTGAKTVKVEADVIGGSGRTVQMSLRGAYDVTLADSQIPGANVRTTGTFPFGPSAFTVSAGTMTVVKTTDTPSSNVVLGGTDVPLAKYTFTAFGEAVKVETLLVDFTYNSDDSSNAAATLRNGRVLVNGSQVGSTTTLNSANTGTSFTTNFVVEPGSPATVEVRSDIYDNDGTDEILAADTILVTLSQGSSNGIPQESLTPINVPTSNQAASTVTVASGTLTLAKNANYGNRNVVVPQTQSGGYLLADFNLSNNNVEKVNANTLTLTSTSGVGGTFGVADLQNVYIKYGSSTTAIKSTVTSGQAFSVTLEMAPNTTIPVQVWGNIVSGAVTEDDTLIMNVAVTATTASGQSANVSATAGQTLTAKDGGTLTATLNTASSPVAQIVKDNQTVTTGVFNFTSTEENFTVTDVTVTLGNISAVTNVIVKNAATGVTLASKPAASTTVTFNDISLPVATNGTSALSVELELGSVGVSAGSTGASIQTTLTAATVKNGQGTSSAASGLSDGVNANAMYVYAAVPEISLVALPTTTLTPNSEVVMSKFTVGATGGTIEWDEIMFTVAKTASVGIIVQDADLKLYDVTSGGRVEVAGAFTTVAADSSADLETADTSGTIAFNATTPEQLSSTKTYELVETNGSAVTANGSMSTRITQPSSYAASVAQGSVAGDHSFVWSDISAQSHSVLSTDWTNDYKVTGLPTTTQTVSITSF